MAPDSSTDRGSPPLTDGAEAQVEATTFHGIPAVRKTRRPKDYRPPALDGPLREGRLRTEIRLLRDARRAGIRTPVVLDVDLAASEIVLERLEGRTLTDLLQDPRTEASLSEAAMLALGRALGKLHAANLTHGDLTGSNVLWQGRDVALIDLSLGSRSPGLEEMGIDLHLVEEDLQTLRGDAEGLFGRVLQGYRETHPKGAEAVIERSREIRGRVRYA